MPYNILGTGDTEVNKPDEKFLSSWSLYSVRKDRHYIMLMKKLLYKPENKMEHFIQANLRIIIQETVFQKALRTVPKR